MIKTTKNSERKIFARDFWIKNKGKKYGLWVVLGVKSPSELNKAASRQMVSVQCSECGNVSNVAACSLLYKTSKACMSCRFRKWDLEYAVTEKNSKIWKLHQIWRKYKNDYSDEWKNNFEAYADFVIKKLRWRPGKDYIHKLDRKKPMSETNVYIIRHK
ncbi:MAG: hypothetical protein LBF00_00845 [Mycoplasmataceae bacterium]|jgi:hypothetical protein|nr:hypothetical protein [Mycoplasmataceae bacterium]